MLPQCFLDHFLEHGARGLQIEARGDPTSSQRAGIADGERSQLGHTPARLPLPGEHSEAGKGDLH